jgi:hypothetical protein
LVDYQFLPNQNYGKPKLRFAKIKAAKVMARNIGVHLVGCQNQCSFFGNEPIDDYKFWHAMALAMQELKANQLGPWILCYFGPSGWDFFSNQGEGTEDIYRYQFAVLCYLLQPREGYC